MLISSANKGSYFILEVKIHNSLYRDGSRKLTAKIETEVEVILSNMTTRNNVYRFESEDKIIYVLEHNKEKEVDPRKIITLYDKEGNCGNSSFFKYLYYHNPTLFFLSC